MKKMTVEFSDEELMGKIERFAEVRGLEVEDASVRLLRKGVGLPEVPRPPGPIGNALDQFFGVWTKEEAEEQNRYIMEARRMDKEAQMCEFCRSHADDERATP